MRTARRTLASGRTRSGLTLANVPQRRSSESPPPSAMSTAAVRIPPHTPAGRDVRPARQCRPRPQAEGAPGVMRALVRARVGAGGASPAALLEAARGSALASARTATRVTASAPPLTAFLAATPLPARALAPFPIAAPSRATVPRIRPAILPSLSASHPRPLRTGAGASAGACASARARKPRSRLRRSAVRKSFRLTSDRWLSKIG